MFAGYAPPIRDPLSEVESQVPIKTLLNWPRAANERVDDGEHAGLAALSNRAGTAWRRHVQSVHESGDRRNPDTLAGSLLDEALQVQCRRMDAESLQRLRRDPYHLFLVARTQAHDQALLDAVAHGVRRVLILGSGLDTRFYRFGAHLAEMNVALAEADQPNAIGHKKEVAARLPYADRVLYLPVDLNVAASWAPMLLWLAQGTTPCLVIAEGVSPYIDHAAFVAVLGELARVLPPGSRVSYDFKRVGVNDAFGASKDVTRPFRLAPDAAAVAEFHRGLGFRACSLVGAAEMMNRHVPSWSPQESPLFEEDDLLSLVR